jgi:hypothetical protein
MKKLTMAAGLVAAMAFGGAVTAVAQSAARVYDQGPVWDISHIETMPGMFDDYMAYLAGPYRQLMEADKRSGDLIDYKVLAVVSPRDNEPDVLLITQYKNMAAFDRSLDELDRRASQVFGSTVRSNQATAQRVKMRESRGSVMAREVRFK